MESEPKPVIVIAGATASGKSNLAIKLAKKYKGEIISADSRTIYKGMDIGTAKPTAEDRSAVPHHGLDLIEPSETFSAAEFQIYAKAKVSEIHDHGRLPIIVGGTGLYIDGLVYDFTFTDALDPALRQRIGSMTLEELQAEARVLGIDESEVNFANPRHLGRAIERGGLMGSRKDLPANILYIGLAVDKEMLNERVAARVDKMFAAGLVEEVQNLIKKFGSEAPGLLAPGYKDIASCLDSGVSLEEVKELLIRSHQKLAKRQITWFKRNSDIVWCETEHQVEQVVGDFLGKFDTINA